MNLSRYAPLQHPFASTFARAIDSICAPLSPATDRVYRGAARNFLLYLLDSHPQAALMNLSRYSPLQHPFASTFARAIDSICAPLSPATDRVYRGAARNFLLYLLDSHPQLLRLQDLRRETHVLGWLAHLRSRHPPLAPTTYIIRIILLRCVFQQLAWSEQLPELGSEE